MEKKWFFIEVYGRHQNSNIDEYHWKTDVFYEDETSILERILVFKQGSISVETKVSELQKSGVKFHRTDLSSK